MLGLPPPSRVPHAPRRGCAHAPSVPCNHLLLHACLLPWVQVCSGETGHSEVVQVLYDPSQVAYDRLLDVFFDKHDPTQLNRQGGDVGTQYRWPQVQVGASWGLRGGPSHVHCKA